MGKLIRGIPQQMMRIAKLIICTFEPKIIIFHANRLHPFYHLRFTLPNHSICSRRTCTCQRSCKAYQPNSMRITPSLDIFNHPQKGILPSIWISILPIRTNLAILSYDIRLLLFLCPCSPIRNLTRRNLIEREVLARMVQNIQGKITNAHWQTVRISPCKR